MNEIRVSIIGGLGKMGKSNIEEIALDSILTLVAAVLKRDDSSLHKDVGNFCVYPKKQIYFTYEIDNALEIGDVIVDFTDPKVTNKVLKKNQKYKKPLIIGTTNLSYMDELESYAKLYPILYSSNFSYGMNILFYVLDIVGKKLNKSLNYDIELVESHHRFKKDKPSGSAMEILKIVAKSSDRKFPECIYYHSNNKNKTIDHIGVSTQREGGIIGYHQVKFTDLYESFQLSHQAYSRKAFSKGVVLAIKFLFNKKPKLYSMFDVLSSCV